MLYVIGLNPWSLLTIKREAVTFDFINIESRITKVTHHIDNLGEATLFSKGSEAVDVLKEIKSRYDEIHVEDVSPVGAVLNGNDIDPNDLHIYVLDIIGEVSNAHAIDDYEEEEYIPSATNGDYSPSKPWDTPGMSIKDFI